jgi:hypothetical protein
VKILFICSAEQTAKVKLASEFQNEFYPINNRKTARKAAFARSVFKADSISASIFSALENEQIFSHETESSKIERKRLEQKWSFSEMVESLNKRDFNGSQLIGIKSLLHMYGMASHLIHADKVAMDLMADRALREPGELKILEASHACRILTDQVFISWFCAEFLRQHFQAQFIDDKKLRDVCWHTLELSQPFQDAFSDSQRDFYATWQNNG